MWSGVDVSSQSIMSSPTKTISYTVFYSFFVAEELGQFATAAGKFHLKKFLPFLPSAQCQGHTFPGIIFFNHTNEQI